MNGYKDPIPELRLKNYATGAQIERERIVALIREELNTWRKPAAFNYRTALAELINKIEGKQND